MSFGEAEDRLDFSGSANGSCAGIGASPGLHIRRGGCLFGAPVVPARGSVAAPCALGGEVPAAQGVRGVHV